MTRRTLPPAPARAIGYLRAAVAAQVNSSLARVNPGLEAQRAVVAAAAARLGLELAEVFVDAGTSGMVPLERRPVLLAAVAALRRGDVLLVAKRDRLSRDAGDVALIARAVKKAGARILSAAGEGTETDDPTSLFQRRILDSFLDSVVEYERAMIAARTRARAVKKAGARVLCAAGEGKETDPVATIGAAAEAGRQS
jgi:DNA invertase Pin-like site-specific DNA recombinase